MLKSTTRTLAIFIAVVFGAISFASHAQAERKKRGYQVHAGKSVGERRFTVRTARRDRSNRRYQRRNGRRDGYRRGYGQRYGYRRNRDARRAYRRGYRVLAGHDFNRFGDIQITLQNDEPVLENEPIVIEPLQHIPKIIKMTEHQKHLGRLRAERRGDSAAQGEAGITVLTKDPKGGLTGGWSERIEKDDFGDETIVYFQD